jgi:hypothetical protein
VEEETLEAEEVVVAFVLVEDFEELDEPVPVHVPEAGLQPVPQ